MQFTVHQPPAQPEELRQLIDKLKFRSRFLNQVQWRFKSSAADIKLITRVTTGMLTCFVVRGACQVVHL